MADDENEPLDERWTGEQTQDETEDQAVDQTRDRVLDQNRGPTGNQGIDPTRFKAKDEDLTVIDPMEEAKSDEDDAEHPQFSLDDDAHDENESTEDESSESDDRPSATA